MQSLPAPAGEAPRSKVAVGVRQILGDAWALAYPFWTDRRERRSWLLLASLIPLTVGAVWLNVQFSNWNNSFYNTPQNHDLPGFWRQLGVFPPGRIHRAAILQVHVRIPWRESEIQRRRGNPVKFVRDFVAGQTKVTNLARCYLR